MSTIESTGTSVSSWTDIKPSQEVRLDVEIEHVPAHRLEVGVASLDLLRDGVRIAEPALEGMVLEDRSGAGKAVDLLGDGGRLN